MAPISRKRKSEALEETPQAVTPTGSPAPKRLKITQSQKQALIDNLQLEVTERARHLRAHYALQCADLKARVERRVNRIPIAMRKMTMGELMAKHGSSKPPSKPASIHSQVTVDIDNERPLPPLPKESATKIPMSPFRSQIQPPASRQKKRKSSEINIASDKENDNVFQAQDGLPLPKNSKRAKITEPTRAPSRTGKPASVLSPRSHNSRTLPRSPIKDYPAIPTSPTKSMIARPISPLKPVSPFKSAATAASSAISASVHGMIEHAKRGTAATAGKLSRTASKEKPTTTSTVGKMLPPPRPLPTTNIPSSPQRTISQSTTATDASDLSSTSSGTILTKPKRGRAAAPKTTTNTTEKKPTTASKVATAAKTALKRNNTNANKKVVVAEPAAGRRVLRKRN